MSTASTSVLGGARFQRAVFCILRKTQGRMSAWCHSAVRCCIARTGTPQDAERSTLEARATRSVGVALLLGTLGAVVGPSLRAQDKSPDALLREGTSAFFDAKPAESVAAFDKLIALAPNAAPQLWQRGLSLYYAEKFAEGRKQFELHQTVNPNDVENAAWHFICVAKTDGVEAARRVLIPIEGDSRVPMKEVHDLFAGKGTEEDVMKAANAGADGDAKRNHLCYAHLYLGLYHEALGHAEKAKGHMLKAAVDYKMDHYMGKCAQVHVKLRGWDSK